MVSHLSPALAVASVILQGKVGARAVGQLRQGLHVFPDQRGAADGEGATGFHGQHASVPGLHGIQAFSRRRTFRIRPSPWVCSYFEREPPSSCCPLIRVWLRSQPLVVLGE